MGKLFLLVTVKFASRDPAGMGIEYEGGKPGWNDAMNGLVGMLGSGLPETYELLNLLRYVRTAVNKFRRPIEVPKELAVLIHRITIGLDRLDALDRLDLSDGLDGSDRLDELDRLGRLDRLDTLYTSYVIVSPLLRIQNFVWFLIWLPG